MRWRNGEMEGLGFGVGISCLCEFARMFGRCGRRDTLYLICTQYMNQHTDFPCYKIPHSLQIHPLTLPPLKHIGGRLPPDRLQLTCNPFHDFLTYICYDRRSFSKYPAASRTSKSMPTCPTICNPTISPST